MIWIAMTAAFAAEPDWSQLEGGWEELATRSSEVGEVTVRRKKVGELGCVEGTVRVAVPPGKLLQVTDNMVSSIEWGASELTVSEELARDASGFVLFQYFNTPGWTLSADRFWVVRGTAQARGDGGVYRWHRVDAAEWPAAVEKAQAISASVIEPPVNFGEWVFEPAAEGTDLRYRACADFGGRVPDSIQYRLNTRQVPDLVADVVREAGRR